MPPIFKSSHGLCAMRYFILLLQIHLRQTHIVHVKDGVVAKSLIASRLKTYLPVHLS